MSDMDLIGSISILKRNLNLIVYFVFFRKITFNKKMEEDKKILLLEETVAQLDLRNKIITQIYRIMDITVSKEAFLEKVVKILEEAVHCDVRIMEKNRLTGRFLFYPKKNEDELTDEDMERQEFIIRVFNEVEKDSISGEKPGLMSFPIGKEKDISGII